MTFLTSALRAGKKEGAPVAVAAAAAATKALEG